MTRQLLTIASAAVTALVLSAVALAAAPTTVTQTAQSGSVKATFTYTVTTSKTMLPMYSGEHLTIVRAGQTAYSGAVRDPNCVGCDPAEPGPKGHSIQLVDINHVGEPNAILTLYTGGAHCCTIAQVFTYSVGTHAYVELEHNFADPSYKLKPLGPGGVYRFVSADPRFEYEFTDFADSGVPIQIWGIVNGKFADVTRSYPSLIAADAAKWLKAFNGPALTNGGGLLAAWAGDEELLGKNALVQSTLQSELKAGRLNGNLVANGRRYINLLNSFLKKLGYEK